MSSRSVIWSKPFEIDDYRKCEMLNKKLKNIGKHIEMSEVDYKTTTGSRIDDLPVPKAAKDKTMKRLILYGLMQNEYGEIVKHDKPSQCILNGHDTELNSALYDYGKYGGVEATAFGINLEKNRVESADIPVNLASCDDSTSFRKEDVVVGDMPAGCKIESIHARNSSDKNPAVHLHISCDNTDENTLDFLARLVGNANTVGRTLCAGNPIRLKNWTTPTTRKPISTYLDDDTRKSKQTKMIMY